LSPVPPGLPILAERQDFVFTLAAWRTVLVRAAPGILRHAFLQVGAIPLGAGARRCGHQGVQALFRAGIAANVEAVGVERLVEGFDLRLRHRHFGLAELREILGTDIGREQADDHDHYQQLEQGETRLGAARATRRSLHPHVLFHS